MDESTQFYHSSRVRVCFAVIYRSRFVRRCCCAFCRGGCHKPSLTMVHYAFLIPLHTSETSSMRFLHEQSVRDAIFMHSYVPKNMGSSICSRFCGATALFSRAFPGWVFCDFVCDLQQLAEFLYALACNVKLPGNFFMPFYAPPKHRAAHSMQFALTIYVFLRCRLYALVRAVAPRGWHLLCIFTHIWIQGQYLLSFVHAFAGMGSIFYPLFENAEPSGGSSSMHFLRAQSPRPAAFIHLLRLVSICFLEPSWVLFSTYSFVCCTHGVGFSNHFS